MGRAYDGVCGAPLFKLLFAGVIIVKLMFPSLRLGGVGGLTNAGEAGAETLSWLSSFLRGAVAIARPRLYAAEVLTARFLRFRGLLAGVAGLCSSNTGKVGMLDFGSMGVNLDSFMAKDIAVGDCGDGPGDGSVILDESNETVVVGDESADSEADVEVLFLVWWNGLKDGGPMGLKIVSEPWGSFSRSEREALGLCDRASLLVRATSCSNTDMKVGMGDVKDGFGACILTTRAATFLPNFSKLIFLRCDDS